MKKVNLRGYPDLDYRSQYDIPDGPYELKTEQFQCRIERTREYLGQRDLDGILVMDPLNIIYLSGLHFLPTERPMGLYIPAQEGSPMFLIPRIDEAITGTWWLHESCSYFDYPLSDGNFKCPGQPVAMGDWFIDTIERNRGQLRRLAIDDERVIRTAKKYNDLEVVENLADCLMMRRIMKGPEEIELMRKAIGFGDLIMEYAYHLVHEYGTDLRDVDIRRICEAYGQDLMFSRVELDGRPHKGAGTGVDVWCRAGATTAYPHPNQPSRTRIERNQSLQFALVIRVAGYAGEYYRGWHVAPMEAEAEELWTAHTEVTILQQKLSRDGMKASDIASRCLGHYEDRGLSRYVYHRPGHGQGVEGHQPPYISLGDNTILREGMCWSNEPGLYHVEGGYGYNHSNLIITRQAEGEVPNRWPLDLERSLIRI